MKFFEPNEKRNTIAAYVFLVALFSVLCVMFWINIAFFNGVLDFVIEVFKPIIYGFIIAFLLHPMVKFVELNIFASKKEKRIGFRHFMSVIIVYLFVFFVAVLFVAAIYPEVQENYQGFYNDLQDFISTFRDSSAEFINSTTKGDKISIVSNADPALRVHPSDDLFTITIKSIDGVGYSATTAAVKQSVLEFFDGLLTAIEGSVKQIGIGILSQVGTVVSETKNIIIGVVLSLYFLVSEHNLRFSVHRIVRSWLPSKVYKAVMWLTDKAKNIFRDYIVVRFLDGVIVGGILFLCLLVFRIQFSALLAVIIGVSALFPFFGPVIGITVGTLLLLVVDFKSAIFFLVVAIILSLLDSRYVEPFLDAGRCQHKLAPIWVFVAIIVMGGLFGVIGIMLGIPFFAFIYSIIKDLCQRRLRAKNLPEDTFEYYADKIEKQKEVESV